MQAAVAGEKTKKFYLYSGHDNTGELLSLSCLRTLENFWFSWMTWWARVKRRSPRRNWLHDVTPATAEMASCLAAVKDEKSNFAIQVRKQTSSGLSAPISCGMEGGGCVRFKLKRDICDLPSYGINWALVNFMAVPMVSFTVMPLLLALNASDYKWCPYASMVQLELLEVLNPTNTDYAVRLLFNGEERLIKSYCDASPCSLAQFMEFIRDNTPKDRVTDCSVTNHDVMFGPSPPIFSRAHDALFWFETGSNAWISVWFWMSSSGRVHQSSFTDLILPRWSLSANNTNIFFQKFKRGTHSRISEFLCDFYKWIWNAAKIV